MWIGNLLVLSVMLIAPPSPSMAQQNTGKPPPNGLVVVLPPGKQKEQLMKWRDIEPIQGKPDWSILDPQSGEGSWKH
jgi:hypothetical protein